MFDCQSKQKIKNNFNILPFLALIGIAFVSSFFVKSKTSILGVEKNSQGFGDLLPTIAPYPVYRGSETVSDISAKSAVIVDINSAVIVYEKNAEAKLPLASTTKIMTALVALEDYSLDQILTVNDLKVDGNNIGLVAGEQITFENLLYGLLVASGNDAAEVLAINYPGGAEKFIEAMNQKAAVLKLDNTHYTNTVGFDENGHYSTAKDLARLSAVAIKNPILRKIVSTSEIEISDVSGKIKHPLKNTNELVGKVEGVIGIKTGWTQEAGECLVSLAERNGRDIMIVVLGSSDRFGESKKLIDWVFNNFQWETIAPSTGR